MLSENKEKILIEIWSDVMGPFCYIGKRRLESALEKFPKKANVEIVWKSFQLNPDMKTKPTKNFKAYFSEGKNIEDSETLKALGLDAGLPASEIDKLLAGEDFSKEVRRDVEEAR